MRPALATVIYVAAAAVNIVAFILVAMVRETHRAAVPGLKSAPAV